MAGIWFTANVEQLEFAATATLLAIRAKHQSIVSVEQIDAECSDESESEHDEEVERGASKRRAQLTTSSRCALKDKFLDRLGEVFSHEKSSNQRGSRPGPKHVGATAWIRPSKSSPLTVILAKNEGLDEIDRKMMLKLELWLRAVAATGRHSQARTDVMWVGDFGLVKFSRGRLWYHIGQITQLDRPISALAEGSSIYGPVITCLQGLCRKATIESTVQQLSDIVNIAYIVRCGWKDLEATIDARKALRCISMLGRLRAAYENFKAVALTFEEMSTLEVRPVLLHQPVEINVVLFRKHLQRLTKEFGLPKGALRNKAALRYTGASRLFVHAEMQILVSLSKNADWHQRAHSYIGISRKPCFLCNQILQNYKIISVTDRRQASFKTRPSHGKIYPLWTLPQNEVLSCVANLAMATATIHTYHLIQQESKHGPVLKPAVAESTVGFTDGASISDALASTQRQRLAYQRLQRLAETISATEVPINLGRKIKSVQVGLLPSDGSKPRLTLINFFALPDSADRRLQEVGREYVPDFQDFWGGYQFDRRYRNLKLENQAVKELEGDYRLYWNENHELPENNYIKNLLGIKKVEIMRRFWYGDFFIVRYTEYPTTFFYDVHHLPISIFQERHLETVLKDMWEAKFLEAELERDQYCQESQEKIEADKEIIFQRMTSIEREILSRLPSSTLEYLALVDCDDNALRNFSVEEDPNDPSMVQITISRKRRPLDSVGWTGFDSSQL